MTTTVEWRKWNAIQTKPVTNADRIRAMTDEELAHLLHSAEDDRLEEMEKWYEEEVNK